MKRSTWTLVTIVLAGGLIALPVLAAGPSATKAVIGTENGTAVIVINVAASGQAIYGVNIKDESGSIKDIVAPKEWVGISSGDEVIFRTGAKPIQPGSTLSFRVYTGNEGAQLSVSFRDKDSPIGSATTL